MQVKHMMIFFINIHVVRVSQNAITAVANLRTARQERRGYQKL